MQPIYYIVIQMDVQYFRPAARRSAIKIPHHNVTHYKNITGQYIGTRKQDSLLFCTHAGILELNGTDIFP